MDDGVRRKATFLNIYQYKLCGPQCRQCLSGKFAANRLT